jgi:hypothetical protein
VSTAATELRLDKNDRCDGCPAQAQVQVTLPNGFDLLFCAHHFTKNEAALIGQQSAKITVDQRASINGKPSMSANAL